jgi:hypothetical protein
MKIKIELNLSENVEIYRQDVIDELNRQIDNEIKNSFKSAIRSALEKAIMEESKNHNKVIKENVGHWIRTMPSTELFYGDEFRAHLVATAKTMQKDIDTVIRNHINTCDTGRLFDALGSSVADKFYGFIRNENY